MSNWNMPPGVSTNDIPGQDDARADGGPAFSSPFDEGMTLRDYFAAKAPSLPQHVQEAFVGKRRDEIDLQEYAKISARWRFIFADAMLAARSA
jgi:hypothetical protein